MTMSGWKHRSATSESSSQSSKMKGLSSSFHETSGTKNKFLDLSQESNLSDFQKSLSLDRKSKWKDNKGKDRDSKIVAIHGTPKRMPPKSPATPSLWKRIFSFKKGGFSSQKDLTSIGKYGDDDNKSESQDSLETNTDKKFKRISNRLISQLRQGNIEPNSSRTTSNNAKQYRRTQSDTVCVQDGNNNPSPQTNTLSPSNLNISAVSAIDINGNVNNEVNKRNNGDKEKVIKFKHYKCHPHKGSGSPRAHSNATPPLVMFSSDEDISSQHTTPVHQITSSNVNNDNLDISVTEIEISSYVPTMDSQSLGNKEMSESCHGKHSYFKIPSKVSPCNLNDKKKNGRYVERSNSVLLPASSDQHILDFPDSVHTATNINFSTLGKNSSVNALSSHTDVFLSSQKHSPVHKLVATMKEEIYEGSGNLPSTQSPIVKPRPKVKRSVSCSPARPTRTISAELEEKIGKILRGPPQRRFSNEKITSPLRHSVFLNRRASTSEKYSYTGSLLSNTENTVSRRLSYLAHSKSVPYQCSALDKSSDACVTTANDVISTSGNSSLYCNNNHNNSKHNFKSMLYLSSNSSVKPGVENSNANVLLCSKKLNEPQSDAVNYSNSHSVHRKYTTAGLSDNKKLFQTRRRHHTIELGNPLSHDVGNTSYQNNDALIEIKKKNTTQIPLHKRGIDLKGKDSIANSSINVSNNIVSTASQENCTDSIDGENRKFRGHIATYKRDKSENDKIYQSAVFVKLKNNGENIASTEFSQRQINKDKLQSSKRRSTATIELKNRNKLEMCEGKPIVDIVTTDIDGNMLSNDSNVSDKLVVMTSSDGSKFEGNLTNPENYTESVSETELRIQEIPSKVVTKEDVGCTYVVNSTCTDKNDQVKRHMLSTDVQLRNTPEKESTEYSYSEALLVQQRSPKERPKSEILCVRWADETDIVEVSAATNLIEKRTKRTRKERPKSDIGGRKLVTEAIQSHKDLEERISDSVYTLQKRPQKYELPWEKSRLRQRRMSTPHPIKIRPTGITGEDCLIEDSSCSSSRAALLRRMKRCKSVPNLSITQPHKKRKTFFHASSAHAGDLALQPIDFNDTSDDEATSEETASIGAVSEVSSAGSTGKQALDQLFDEEKLIYAEALWDHVTLDLEELAFQVGEVIKVTDMTDKDWWYGIIDDREGWFPAAFVRLHANQMNTADDFVSKVKAGHMDGQTVLQTYSSNLLSKDQARTNVVTEIINAEREYVKHLKDVVEGYVEKARKRPEMFPDNMLKTIFSNIEDIYKFSSQFLRDLEKHIHPTSPHISEIGKCFLNNNRGFEIYSEYCNNHPSACDELRVLQKNQKYKHFFEACRLLQQMIEIPLEGFLLTPVQKICKYPLQLKELLKYTRPEHPDCRNLQEALESMRHIAMLINERKRKLESVEKLAQWQQRVEDWEGNDLIEESSELIYSGEMTKVNTNGWHQERVFFLFDHQLVYCKKDLLWRDLLIYRGRINLDNCEVHSLQDGKDIVYNTNIKNGIKVYDSEKDRWFLMYCKTPELKEKWLNAFQQERHRVMQDRANGFHLEEYRKIAKQNYSKEKSKKDKKNRLSSKDLSYKLPSRQLTTTEAIQYAQSHNKKSSGGFLPFLKRKMKR